MAQRLDSTLSARRICCPVFYGGNTMNDTTTTIEAINWETVDYDALLPPILAGATR